MPLFRVRRFRRRFPRRQRDKAKVTDVTVGNKTMQSELKKLVNTVSKPIARKVKRFSI